MYDEYVARCEKHAMASARTERQRGEEARRRLLEAKVATERQRCRILARKEKLIEQKERLLVQQEQMKDVQGKRMELKLQRELAKQSKRGADRALVVIPYPPSLTHPLFFRSPRSCTPCVSVRGSSCSLSSHWCPTPSPRRMKKTMSGRLPLYVQRNYI